MSLFNDIVLELANKNRPLSRYETMFLKIICAKDEILSSEFRDASANLGSHKVRINKKFADSNINKKIICNKIPESRAYLWKLIDV